MTWMYQAAIRLRKDQAMTISPIISSNKSLETNAVSRHIENITFFNIRTIPSTPELHRICASQRLWVFTTDRELRIAILSPCPEGNRHDSKSDFPTVKLKTCKNVL